MSEGPGIHCTQCGKKMRPEAEFCPYCGAVLFKPLATEPAVADGRVVRSNRRRTVIIVLATAVLVLAATGAGILFGATGGEKPTSSAVAITTSSTNTTATDAINAETTITKIAQPTSTKEPTTTVEHATTSTILASTSTLIAGVKVTLPVQVLKKDDINNSGVAYAYPPSIDATIPKRWVDKVAAYGVAGVIVIAPSEWTTADGYYCVDLKSTDLSSIPGTLHCDQTAGRVVAAWMRAAEYFPWVHDQWKDRGLPSELRDVGMPDDPPELRPGMAITMTNQHLMRYRIAPTGDQGEVNGVARTGIGVENDGDSFYWLEVTLPTDAADLAAAILDFYLAHEDDYNLR
jgi:hypothetical protein